MNRNELQLEQNHRYGRNVHSRVTGACREHVVGEEQESWLQSRQVLVTDWLGVLRLWPQHRRGMAVLPPQLKLLTSCCASRLVLGWQDQSPPWELGDSCTVNAQTGSSALKETGIGSTRRWRRMVGRLCQRVSEPPPPEAQRSCPWLHRLGAQRERLGQLVRGE